VRQANSFGHEARPQAANSKAQDKAGREAKACVSRLYPPGGKEGVAEDSRQAA